jgi:hypothetical protein
MGQQEFEPQEQPYDEDLDPLRYPYSWSDQPRQRGMPRDERPASLAHGLVRPAPYLSN